jgi:hypothetical protein
MWWRAELALAVLFSVLWCIVAEARTLLAADSASSKWGSTVGAESLDWPIGLNGETVIRFTTTGINQNLDLEFSAMCGTSSSYSLNQTYSGTVLVTFYVDRKAVSGQITLCSSGIILGNNSWYSSSLSRASARHGITVQTAGTHSLSVNITITIQTNEQMLGYVFVGSSTIRVTD